MATWPFPFLRHGVGVSNSYSLWVAAAAPTIDLGTPRALRATPLRLTTSGKGPVLEARSSQFKKLLGTGPRAAAATHALIDDALREMHEQTPLALVVRDNRVEPSPWHHDTLAAPVRLFEALERLMTSPGPYLSADFQTVDGAMTVSESMLGNLSGHPLASMLRATCRVLIDSASGKKARAVLEDQLSERLPSWLGHDFTVDLVVRERLSLTLSISPLMVEMPPRFYTEEARLVAENHADAHRGRAEAAAEMQREGTGVDWGKLTAVRAAIAAGELRQARDGFLDTDEGHVKTLLALTHEERLKLISQRTFSTLIANAATNLTLSHRRFADALLLYDAAIEGRLEPMAAANPLYAVQDDNNHLGVDAARSRRYLERCLPHGPANPAVFLNGACVAMEINELDQAIELLKAAKAHRFSIKQYKNERLFVPLRGRADFKALMR